MVNRSILKLALPLIMLGACAHSQGEKVRDARLEQVDAQAKADVDAVDQKYRAGGEVVQEQYDGTKAAIDQAQPPAEGATKELATVSKERADYQNSVQARLEKAAVRLKAAQAKIDILAGRAPSSLQTTLDTAKTEHQSLLQDAIKLGAVPPDAWGASKSSIEGRLSDLDRRVSELDGAIKGV